MESFQHSPVKEKIHEKHESKKVKKKNKKKKERKKSQSLVIFSTADLFFKILMVTFPWARDGCNWSHWLHLEQTSKKMFFKKLTTAASSISLHGVYVGSCWADGSWSDEEITSLNLMQKYSEVFIQLFRWGRPSVVETFPVISTFKEKQL